MIGGGRRNYEEFGGVRRFEKEVFGEGRRNYEELGE